MPSFTLQLNGQLHTTSAATLSALVAELGLKPDRIAVECNGEIARRPLWDAQELHPNDKIEIVHFVGGGTPPPKLT